MASIKAPITVISGAGRALAGIDRFTVSPLSLASKVLSIRDGEYPPPWQQDYIIIVVMLIIILIDSFKRTLNLKDPYTHY